MTDFNPDEVGTHLLKGLSNAQQMIAQARAQMIEEANPRFEYARVDWDQVNPMAREGWTLVPMGPVQVFGSVGHGFVMQRKLGAADEAAALLQQPAGAQP